MLVDVVGDLLPFAVGVALSPVPIVATTVVLGAPGARGRGVAFALGWIAGLVVISSLVVLVVDGEPGGEPSTAASWVKVAFGALFLALAAKQWRARPREGVEPEPPTWMAALDEMSTGRIALLAAAVSGLNPKNLALTLAAAATIAQAGLSGGATAAAVAAFVALGSVTVAGPVAFYLVAPGRAAGSLRSVKELMAANNAVIMVVVLLLLGSKLLGDGIAGI